MECNTHPSQLGSVKPWPACFSLQIFRWPLAVPELHTTPFQGSSVCKHCHHFAGRWEGLNSPGAQVDGEHHPQQQTAHMNGFIHSVYSLPTPLTSRLRNSPGHHCTACSNRFLAWYFLAVLFTPSKVCTSLHFSLAVRWLGTVLCTGVEATLRQGVVDWRGEVKPLKVQVLLLCLNFGNTWMASSWMLNAAFR